MGHWLKIVILILYIVILLGCRESSSKDLVLFDFESDSELDQFHWRCHTLFSLSQEHITHGKRSLMLELYPSDYAGLIPKLKENDWRPYRSLRFDIYNPEETQLKISVRIDDRKDYPKYENRYNQHFIIKPGINKIEIPLHTLITSGSHKKLDLKKICRVYVVMVHPVKRHTLYVDYIRLI
jgi:hypothetical protein